MKEQIIKLATELQPELVEIRRDFHKFAEVGWTEFRTASIIAQYLENLGYDVAYGSDVIDEDTMMGVPAPEVLKLHVERAKKQGAPLKYLEKMAGGKTGVVATLNTGNPGPVIGLRFDIDANDMNETDATSHLPVKHGFASVNKGAMHACAHDGHAAVGMGVAKLLMQLKDQFAGTIKLIFQPAEEGVRGAASMTAKGVVDDLDYFLTHHIGYVRGHDDMLDRLLVCGAKGFLATSKLDIIFKGTPAHAGAKPEEGKSALLAAASCALSLQGIYRHSAGTSRINIGVLNAGTGRNVVPDDAIMKIETRGLTTQINDFVKSEAIRMIHASAKMYDVDVKIKEAGGAQSGTSDQELIEVAKRVGEASGLFNNVVETFNMAGSEDATYFMERVQKNGGKAAYMRLGAKTSAGHHNGSFDFDEDVLSRGVAMDLLMLYELGTQN